MPVLPHRMGSPIAAAAALQFAVAYTSARGAEEATIHWDGVNNFKAQSTRKTKRNACKGQNECWGTGF